MICFVLYVVVYSLWEREVGSDVSTLRRGAAPVDNAGAVSHVEAASTSQNPTQVGSLSRASGLNLRDMAKAAAAAAENYKQHLQAQANDYQTAKAAADAKAEAEEKEKAEKDA